jgi:hypothetical protein
MITRKQKLKNSIRYTVIFGDEIFEIEDHLKPRNIVPYNPEHHKQVVLLRRSKSFKPNALIGSMSYQIASFDNVKDAKKYIKDRKYL